MSRHLLAVATLPHRDGYARDDVKLSTVYTAADGVTDNAVASVFADFFIVPQSNTKTVQSYLGNSRVSATNACRIDLFDISGHLLGDPHGSPIYTKPFTLVVPTGNQDLPAEVAACVSFRAAGAAAAPEEGAPGAIPTPARAQAMGAPATHTGRPRPRARYRGRIYVGPLSTSCIDSGDPDHRGRLDGTFRQTLGLAGRALVTNSATIGAPLGVWSRRDGIVRPVDTVTVDDAFDIQRRRGEKYVTRGSY